jgi:hypothetical protein
MEHIAALLLIVGCSGDLGECKELPAPTPIFETMEECSAELPVALKGAEGQDAKVFADCVYVDPAMEEEDAMLEWDVTRDGKLVASVTADGGNVVIASSSPDGDRLHRQ